MNQTLYCIFLTFLQDCAFYWMKGHQWCDWQATRQIWLRSRATLHFNAIDLVWGIFCCCPLYYDPGSIYSAKNAVTHSGFIWMDFFSPLLPALLSFHILGGHFKLTRLNIYYHQQLHPTATLPARPPVCRCQTIWLTNP